MEERIEDYIKRIESIIKTLSEHIEFEDYDEDVLKEASEDKEAIENLLKRYKELEEKNKHRLSQVDFLRKEYDIMFDTINNLDFYIDDLIKESKEGIERLDGDDCDTEIRFETEIETLQRIKDKLSNNDFKYKASIPISVIQNKIDYYIGMYEIGKLHEDKASKHQMVAIAEFIKDLQELLEEGKK